MGNRGIVVSISVRRIIVIIIVAIVGAVVITVPCIVVSRGGVIRGPGRGPRRGGGGFGLREP